MEIIVLKLVLLYGVLTCLTALSSDLTDTSSLTPQDSKPNPGSSRDLYWRQLDSHMSLDVGYETVDTIQPLLSSFDSPYAESKDNFNCSVSKCVCYNLVPGLTVGNCSYRHLHHVPNDLPSDMKRLNLNENALKSLDFSVLGRYVSLEVLDVTGNGLSSFNIWNGHEGELGSLKEMNLDSNKFQSLGELNFESMTSLYKLSVAHNELSDLKNETFAGLNQLHMLDISWNKITRIESRAFDSLPKLQFLYLNNNPNLGYYKSHFPPRIFFHLTQLKELRIEGNSGGSADYPDTALSYLKNLMVLRIDGLYKVSGLGPEVKNLTKLQVLQLGYDQKKTICLLRNLTSSFFENVPHLKTFEMYKCLVNTIEPDAFSNLKTLKNLKIAYSRNLGLNQTLYSLESLQNSSLERLSLIHLVSHGSSGPPCRYVTEGSSRYIKNINLRVLDISQNQVAMIEKGFYDALPPSLETLRLRENKFAISTFQLPDIGHLRNLKILDMTSQNIDRKPVPPLKKTQLIWDITQDSGGQGVELHPYQGTVSALSSNILTISDHQDINGNTFMNISNFEGNTETNNMITKRKPEKWPPNLNTIWAPKFTFFGEVVLFSTKKHTNCSLSELDVSHGNLYDWGSGQLPRSVANISLEGNYCKHMHAHFFSKNNSLKILDIRENLLGPQFGNDINGTTLRHLSNLRELDISMNLIYKLPLDFFNGTKSLRALIMSDNKLQTLNIRVAHMNHLKYIDASRNSIAWIGLQTRQDLDFLAENVNHTISLDLRLNPLLCTCGGLEVLSWLSRTKIHLIGEDFLYCRVENNDVGFIGNLTERVDVVARRCARSYIALIASVGGSVVFMTVVFSLAYRCRWKIRYLYKVKLSACFGFRPKHQQSQFKFDAYIIYAEEDRDFVLQTMLRELEQKRGHKLCVEDRDFLPGSYNTTNIACAVHSSTLTIPVVSPDFVQSQYSEYGVQMALCEMLFEKRPCIHILWYDAMDFKLLPRDLLLVIKENKYTEYPPENELENGDINTNFWNEISRMIGHTSNQSQPVLDIQ